MDTKAYNYPAAVSDNEGARRYPNLFSASLITGGPGELQKTSAHIKLGLGSETSSIFMEPAGTSEITVSLDGADC